MKLVHNLGEMDTVLDIELNEYVDTPRMYRTLHNILCRFRVKENHIVLMVKKQTRLARIAYYIMRTWKDTF
jgi:hypothetical protein